MITQSVTFTRTATVDEVTGDVTYGAWTAVDNPEFKAFNVPDYPGYKAIIKGSVAAKTVTPDTSDETTTITYQLDQNQPNDKPDHGKGNPGHNDHGKDNPGQNDHGHNNHNQGKTDNHGGSQNAKTPANGRTNSQDNGSSSANGSASLNGNATAAGQADKAKQASLPQTGRSQSAAAAAGLAVTGLAALLGLGGRKKNKIN